VALGYLPRLRIVYTSERQMGQIYVPFVNWLQLGAVVLAVVGFGSSSNLASAYGIAVTATMLMTTILTFFVVRHGWKYNALLAWLATGFFLVIDLALFSANTLKILHGGWFPLVLGTVAVMVMLTWQQGRALVHENLRQHLVPLDDFLTSLFTGAPTRVEGTAVFFRAEGDGVPHAMLHNLMHNRILHGRTIFLTIHNEDIPRVRPEQRLAVTDLGHDCYQIDLRYGFVEDRDIPAALDACAASGLRFEPMQTSYFIARQNVIPTVGSGMAMWREALFATMSRNARDAADYYRIPANRVVELGTQVEI
jgi:KUP system potassium uptake protein